MVNIINHCGIKMQNGMLKGIMMGIGGIMWLTGVFTNSSGWLIIAFLLFFVTYCLHYFDGGNGDGR